MNYDHETLKNCDIGNAVLKLFILYFLEYMFEQIGINLCVINV